MYNAEKYSYINIREYLCTPDSDETGEKSLLEIISSFFCPINPDVEKFLKNNAIEFTKKSQSVTYLVFSNQGDLELLGYFTIAIKPLLINSRKSQLSNTTKKKLLRIGKYDETNHSYMLSAYLIAQLGKNFNHNISQTISGNELLSIALHVVRELKYLAGGTVVFLEAENKTNLMNFYENEENGFIKVDDKNVNTSLTESHELVQLIKLI